MEGSHDPALPRDVCRPGDPDPSGRKAEYAFVTVEAHPIGEAGMPLVHALNRQHTPAEVTLQIGGDSVDLIAALVVHAVRLPAQPDPDLEGYLSSLC